MTPLRSIIILIIYMRTTDDVHAYSSGAPESVCNTLMPNHNAEPQNGPSPYGITTSTTTVKPGDVVKVTLNGKEDFKGFFLRAQQKDALIDGSFEGNNIGAQRCNGQGLTHINPEAKNNVTFAWTAPAKLEPKPVNFVATFVQQKTVFWTDVTSPNLAVLSNVDPATNNFCENRANWMLVRMTLLCMYFLTSMNC